MCSRKQRRYLQHWWFPVGAANRSTAIPVHRTLEGAPIIFVVLGSFVPPWLVAALPFLELGSGLPDIDHTLLRESSPFLRFPPPCVEAAAPIPVNISEKEDSFLSKNIA